MREKKRTLRQQPNFEQVGYLCRRVMQASLRDLQATIPDLDVTHGQMGTLVLIACNPGITPTEICRAQGHEKPTITASLDKLERKNLITRKASQTDRRSFAIYLTKKGREFFAEINPRARESDRRLTRCLSQAERARLIEYLLRIYYSECTQNESESISAEKIRAIAEKGSTSGIALRRRSNNAVANGQQQRARNEILRHLRQVERYTTALRRTTRALS